MKKIGKFGILAIILLALFICLPQIAHFSTDYLWFSELGYQSVFIKFTFAKFIVGFVVFLLVFLLSYFTLQMTTKYQPEVRVENDTVINVPGKKSGKRMLTLLPSLLLGLLAVGCLLLLCGKIFYYFTANTGQCHRSCIS